MDVNHSTTTDSHHQTTHICSDGGGPKTVKWDREHPIAHMALSEDRQRSLLISLGVVNQRTYIDVHTFRKVESGGVATTPWRIVIPADPVIVENLIDALVTAVEGANDIHLHDMARYAALGARMKDYVARLRARVGEAEVGTVTRGSDTSGTLALGTVAAGVGGTDSQSSSRVSSV